MRKNTQIMQRFDNKNVVTKNTTYIFMFKQLATILLALAIGNTWGQEKASTDSIFYEDFENGLNKWKQVYVGKPTYDWKARNGGYKPTGEDTETKPASAQSGEKNAFFYISSVQYTYATYLISPNIDFSGVKKPLLTFWYSLYEDQMGAEDNPEELITDNYEFTFCYRLSSTSDWVEYREYKDATNDVTPWRCDSIYLPEEICGKTNVQIAFLGKTHSIGHGICIDNIKIKETLVSNKHVEQIYASQPSTDMLPTSSTDNPLMLLRIPVLGNNGTLLLNSITVTALEDASKSINCLKLFYSEYEEFRPQSQYQLATASISNGKATFNNINYDLPLGNAYIWITCDVKDEDGEHRLKNNVVDLMIEPNAIDIGGATYPTDALSPTGSRLINESIFFDNFEIAKADWQFDGEFERAVAQGLGGTNGGNKDANYARSGSYIIGTDITGIGTETHSAGNYEKNIDSRAYSATTSIFDGYYYRDINILFYRWLNINTGDSAFVSYSLNGGTTWADAWRTTAIMQESSWAFQKLNISKYADRSDSINVQFSLGPTPSQLQYSGWNIDDFALVGTFVYADAAIDSIISPYTTDCTDTALVSIKIRNAGFNDITIPFTIKYKIDDQDWVSETISGGMARDEVREYVFDTKTYLTWGLHTITTKVILDEDEDSRNDEVTKTFRTQPYLDLPYSQNFTPADTLNKNSGDGFWFGGGENNTWKYSTIDGKKYWATNGESDYVAGDSAWLESPCFNFSNVQKPMISFNLSAVAASTDGLALYYSTDNGASWTLIPYGTSYPRLSWYNTSSNIEALGTTGWSGSFNATFIQQLLPNELSGESSVKLRFLFQSAKNSSGGKGFAISNIKLYEAPADAGVAAIVSPVSSCYLLKEQPITISIKNYGIRGLTSADSLFATVTINNTRTLTDTFLIAQTDTIEVGGTRDFTFTQTVNMWNKKSYEMAAYTSLIGDTLLFSALDAASNDTAKAIATVLGEPAYTLGADRGTLTPSSINIFGGKTSDGNWFTSYLWEPYLDADGLEIANHTDIYQPAPHSSTERWIGVKDSDKLPDFPEGKEKGFYYEYTITVTNSENCKAYDTIRIIKSESNVGIDKVAFKFDAEDENETPQEFTRANEGKPEFGNTQYCISKQPEVVTITIKNAAGVEVSEGEKISIYYTYFDADTNQYTYTEDTIMAGEMAAGATFEYTLKQVPELAISGVQNLYFFVRINADMNHNNDSATLNVDVWPLPVADISLGNTAADSILEINPINKLLTTVEVENASYLWQDGLTTTRSFEITDNNTQKYWVEVADEHSCGIAYDTILIVSDSWKIDAIISPIDQCEPTDAAELTISLTNNSNNQYEAGYKIPATITVNGETTNKTISLKNTLAAGGTTLYTLGNRLNMSEAGEYQIDVQLKPTHDIDRSDNTYQKDVNIWGVWQVDLGADMIYTLEADTITLYAGGKNSKFDGGKFMSYRWSTDETTAETAGLESFESSLEIPTNKMETYHIYVEDYHDCPSSEADVTIMPFDLSITEISSPKTSCNLNSITTAELRIRNSGNESISDGSIINIYVQTDEGEVFEHEQDITEEILVGESKVISFSYTPTFTSEAANHKVKMWLSWELDKFNYNDTLTQTVTQYGTPETFDLGSDIYTTQPDTITLTAPAGYHDYIWSNDVTGSNTLNITYSGSDKYWVRVLNNYGCYTTDTISIYTTDPTMNIVGGAINSCTFVEGDSVTAQIEVNRYNTIPAGTQFTATYNCNGITSTKEIVTTQEITYSNPYRFTFDDILTISDTGNYTLTTSLQVHNFTDVDTDNNTTTSIVRIGALPLPFQDTVRTYANYYVIDAGTNYKTYNWVGDQFAEQQYAVVSSGNYILNAIDTNNCNITDSTYIFFVKPSYGISRLGFSSTMCAPSELTTISFYLQNTGNDVVATNTTIPVTYQIDDNETISEQYTLNKNLTEGDSVLITFATQTDLREDGKYTLILNANVGEFSASTVKTITVMPNPQPNIGDDVRTEKDSWELTPGINYGVILWSTGETTYNIDVTQTDNYWVTVTNNYGCSANDTVFVYFIQPTLSVSAFNSEPANCGDITDAYFNIDLTNSGEKDVATNKNIGIKCIVDESAITESLKLDNTLYVGGTLPYNMKTPISVTGVGQHNIKFIIDIDSVPVDTATFQVSIFDFPTFNFENDELIVDKYPYTLEAPVEAASYLWSDKSTSNSINVNVDGNYSLTITDDNNCMASDNIFIRLKIDSIPDDTTHHNGINAIAEGEIGIYPNPANNLINIDFSRCQLTLSQVTIMSITGRMVYSNLQTSDIMKIDITDWAQGVYLIRITNGNAAGIIKFVKE